jgi:hypothetical protein
LHQAPSQAHRAGPVRERSDTSYGHDARSGPRAQEPTTQGGAAARAAEVKLCAQGSRLKTKTAVRTSLTPDAALATMTHTHFAMVCTPPPLPTGAPSPAPSWPTHSRHPAHLSRRDASLRGHAAASNVGSTENEITAVVPTPSLRRFAPSRPPRLVLTSPPFSTDNFGAPSQGMSLAPLSRNNTCDAHTNFNHTQAPHLHVFPPQ